MSFKDSSKTYKKIKEFNAQYPGNIKWFRTKKHSELVDKNLEPNEEVIFAFAAQWSSTDGWLDTGVIALTNEKIVVAQKRIFPGFRTISIAPKYFNDITIKAGLIWGTVIVDTAKEKIVFTKVSSKALIHIKNTISNYMLKYKTETNYNRDEDK